PT
ncbi:hypothetical protein N499_1391B, partial [Wolbachia pipientis wVitA]